MENSVPEIRVVRGEGIRPHLADLAALRIGIFREWPYLYDGDEAHEREYLSLYVNSPTAIAVLAMVGERVVGVATALGLEEEPDTLKAPVAAAGLRPDTVLYAAESLLLPAWRGRGVGRRFFAEREAHARALGRDRVVFCRVVRDRADPRRPADAVELDAFWAHRGYAPLACDSASFTWLEIGEASPTPKRMQFWSRRLG